MNEIISQIRRSVYKKEMHKSVLAVEANGIYKEEYQMKMLYYNQIPGILDIRGRGVDEVSIYEYDVSGKKTLRTIYESRKMTKKDIKQFLLQFCGILEVMKNYMLDENNLLLLPEYIFYEKDRFYFCYFPPGGGHVQESFHRLTEFFVKNIDYEDKESVQTTFTLHKETMEENYSLKKIMELLEEKEEKMEEAEEPIIELPDMYEENRIKEENHFWIPVKDFLNRHKKPKWGNWQELYAEEKKL